jgi:hypothetical protein
MSEIPPKDLVPLGIVHNDDHRAELMDIIQALLDDRGISLWGHPDPRSPDLSCYLGTRKLH